MLDIISFSYLFLIIIQTMYCWSFDYNHVYWWNVGMICNIREIVTLNVKTLLKAEETSAKMNILIYDIASKMFMLHFWKISEWQVISEYTVSYCINLLYHEQASGIYLSRYKCERIYFKIVRVIEFFIYVWLKMEIKNHFRINQSNSNWRPWHPNVVGIYLFELLHY